MASSARAWYEEVVADFPSLVTKDISQCYLEESGRIVDRTLTYGEIELDAWEDVLRGVSAAPAALPLPQIAPLLPAEGGVFYDLGSGSGKAVIASALLHPFSRCTGIELQRPVHEVALGLKRKYDALAGLPHRSEISFVCGDIFEREYADADLLFCASTCFTADMMRRLVDAARGCRRGTLFVTFTFELPSSEWRVQDRFRAEMSFGFPEVLVHRKE